MIHAAVIPWLDPNTLIQSFGPYAIIGLGLVVFAETGLLIGFLLPGDTLLISAGVLSVPVQHGMANAIAGGAGGPGGPGRAHLDILWVCIAIALGAILGGEAGYLIGFKAGPRVFQKSEGGLFSKANVDRTNAFFVKYGALAVIVARFVPIVRTFAPVAAGVGHMPHLKYSLYNFIGAVVWGVGLTMLGFGVGHIPIVADFVEKYIDLVLLGVVIVVLLPTLYHYVQALVKARKAKKAHISRALDEQSATQEKELLTDLLERKHNDSSK
jgi:membrane-associated protein